jgi:hypothetical protein
MAHFIGCDAQEVFGIWIHGVLQRYNIDIAVSDLFGDGGRLKLLARQGELPQHTRQSVLKQLQTIDSVETQIGE